MTRRTAPGAGSAGGARSAGPTIVTVIAAIVLIVVAVASVGALGGPLLVPAANGHAPVGDVPGRTPDPVKVFQPAQASAPQVRGTILFAKGGNLWSVSGSDALTQLTTSGRDGSPVWSRDGRTIYFVRTDVAHGDVPCYLIAASGCIAATAHYTLDAPVLSSMPAAGGTVRSLASGLYVFGGGQFTYDLGLYQPALSPDGRQFAVVTDAPDPFVDDYGIGLLPVTRGIAQAGGGSSAGGAGGASSAEGAGGASGTGGAAPGTPSAAPTRLRLPAEQGLGLDDPAWSPDGRTIAYTVNHREGPLGRPAIALLTVATGRVRFLTGYGYGQPSFSPDGRYIVAVRSDIRGRDVVVLDASTGAEVLRVTDDGRSFAPVWSPAGDEVAFLHVNGLTIDLWVATLAGTPGAWTLARTDPLTSQSRLDGTSRPAWSIPAAELAAIRAAAQSQAPGISSSPALPSPAASPSPSGP